MSAFFGARNFMCSCRIKAVNEEKSVFVAL
jgi:hypothetical protein